MCYWQNRLLISSKFWFLKFRTVGTSRICTELRLPNQKKDLFAVCNYMLRLREGRGFRHNRKVIAHHTPSFPSHPLPPKQQEPLVGQGLLIIEASRSHTFRHTQLNRTPLDEWSSRRRQLYWTTHSIHKRQTSLHASGGIRPHNPSTRAAADPCLRPRGHWDRPY